MVLKVIRIEVNEFYFVVVIIKLSFSNFFVIILSFLLMGI